MGQLGGVLQNNLYRIISFNYSIILYSTFLTALAVKSGSLALAGVADIVRGLKTGAPRARRARAYVRTSLRRCRDNHWWRWNRVYTTLVTIIRPFHHLTDTEMVLLRHRHLLNWFTQHLSVQSSQPY